MDDKISIRLLDPILNFDKAIELLEANWKETGIPIEFVASNAKTFYEYMAKLNALFSIGVFNEEELVGYCIITMSPHPLNHSIKVCNVDGIYLIPHLRNGKIVFDMMNSVKSIAKVHKANYIQWHASVDSSFLKVLESRFTPINRYFREQLSYDE